MSVPNQQNISGPHAAAARPRTNLSTPFPCPQLCSRTQAVELGYSELV